jgi:hypothetical protein
VSAEVGKEILPQLLMPALLDRVRDAIIVEEQADGPVVYNVGTLSFHACHASRPAFR